MTDNHYDVIIVGSGPGGGSMAYGLAQTGAKVLILERGSYLPYESQNWNAEAVFGTNRYKSGEFWWDVRQSKEFRAGVHYWVGGNTKMYGAALTRPRRADFEEYQFADGVSPKWPIGYDDLEPYYSKAETIMRVHGTMGEDPDEPEHSAPYPFPAVAHEPYVDGIAKGLAKQGLRPVHLPMGIDKRPGGTCAYCSTCDGFPCLVRAKSDAEVCLVRPALQHPNVEIMINVMVLKLNTDASGQKVVSATCRVGGKEIELTAGTFVVSCGAANSAALLLRSANAKHPNGLANSSDMVGRNYMMHNNAVVLGFDPRRRNDSIFQKTIVINDWYSPGTPGGQNVGCSQLIGKMQGSMLKGSIPWLPRATADWITAHTNEWWLLCEDLPDPNNRVTLAEDGSIRVHYTPNNREALHQLVRNTKKALRGAGFPIVLAQLPGMEVTSHQAGTVKFGDDPKTSVLNRWLRTHDVDNLYVVDASFFPSLPAMGPTLTIVSQGLRVSEHIASSR